MLEVHAAQEFQQVQIADPYIELHTGPGSGYPIFYVEDRGEWIDILKRKTDWFKIRTKKGKEGWVHRSQMERTLTPSGVAKQFKEPNIGDFSKRRWEAGMLGGDFEGSDVLTFYGGYALTENLSAEFSLSQILGSASSSLFWNINLVHQPFPQWRISPFFTIGGGIIDTKAKTTLVLPRDGVDNAAHVGIGARMYLTRRFILRVDYKSYVIFSSDNDNEEIGEWKAGFGFFF